MGTSAQGPRGMGAAMMGGPRFSATSRQEFIADIPLTTTNLQAQLPTNGGLIPNDRFMYGLWMTFEGRLTNPAAGAPTAVLADAPWSLLENITVSGYHRVRAQNEPFINVRGVDLYNLNRIYENCLPFVSPADPQLVPAGLFVPQLSIVGNEFNDVRFSIYVPFTPLNIPIGSQLGYLLDAPNYDRLQLQITFTDGTAVFSGQTSPVTFSAFGSAAGNPRVRVAGQFALGQQASFGFVPARVWRYFAENTTGDIVTTVTGSRQYNVPRGNMVRAILMKTGVKVTGATTGVNAYSTVSDDIFTNIEFMRGLNKSIRFYESYRGPKWETQQSYGMYPATGYSLIDFAQRGRLSESLNTVGLVAGPSGDTDVYIQADTAGAANTAALFMIEELRGIPQRLAARRG